MARVILPLSLILLLASVTRAQHLRIFACAIANDSAGAFMGGSSNGSGLYQSDDTGKTWKHLGWENIKCYSMDMVHSSNGRTLYEATGLGILRSTDYGEHWKQLTDWRISEVMDVAVNQKNPNEIYIATAHGPWRTEDGGKTWNIILQGLPVPYCSRIVSDSVMPYHILLASNAGIFFLLRDSMWKMAPVLQRNYKKLDTIKQPIRSLLQASSNLWIAGSEYSRLLISDDSAKTFRVSQIGGGNQQVWCISDERVPFSSESNSRIRLIGGPSGIEASEVVSDMIGGWKRKDIKNIASCLIVLSSMQGAFMYKAIFGSLDGGLYIYDRTTNAPPTEELPGRQIWTLKSFLVRP